MDYVFYQEYWWFLVSLLGGLLVFLLFVQGGNALIFSLGKNETERKMIVNSTGRKWEFTFTTLVTFGGAFFASFPLFYSTSFGGAYWLWMLILFSFVLQAVSYEYQSKNGNLLGRNTYRAFLVLNGIMGPFLLGCAVATFFTGSAFTVSKGQLLHEAMPVISSWGNSWHGLDALGNVWNVVLGLAVVFLSRVLGALYLINNISDQMIERRARRAVAVNAVFFLIFFLSFVIRLFLTEGFAVDPENGRIFMEPFKYWNNLLALPVVAVIFLLGVAGVLAGILATCFGSGYRKGIWWTGSGTVLAVLGLLLLAGYNHTAYYPSTLDLQSSLTLANSCSSEFTLKTMSVVSLLIPFVLAYIFYAWRCIDRKQIDANEMNDDDHTY